MDIFTTERYLGSISLLHPYCFVRISVLCILLQTQCIHARTKHIEVDYHSPRKSGRRNFDHQFQSCFLSISLANIFTKVLLIISQYKNQAWCSWLLSPSLEGENKDKDLAETVDRSLDLLQLKRSPKGNWSYFLYTVILIQFFILDLLYYSCSVVVYDRSWWALFFLSNHLDSVLFVCCNHLF